MRIVFLAPSLETGGAERQLVELANGLAAKGHDVGVILFRRKGKLLNDLSSSVHLFDLRKGGKFDILPVLIRLVRLIRRFQADVLYSFLGIPNLFSVLIRPWISGMKVVWSLRASNMDLAQYSWIARLCWKLECFFHDTRTWLSPTQMPDGNMP